MNISLTPQLEELVQKKVKSGLYTSASEVVREALRLLEEYDRLRETRIDELRAKVLAGVEQLDRGEGRPFDEAALKRIRAKGQRRLQSARKKKSA